ncbi:MAG: hypothetical protein GX108_06225 [Thermovirga sp.]|nr:hypothetical protein [Thermovirga sp.]
MIMQALRTKTRAIMLVVVVVFVVSLFAMYITRGSGPSQHPGAEKDFAVAIVDGQKVMATQVVAGVRDFVQQTGQSDLSPESIVLMRNQVLHNIALGHMLDKEAVRQNITASREDIEAAVKRIEKQFPTKEAFQQYMESNGIKMKALQERIGSQLAQQMVIEANTPEVEVTDEEARSFYEQTRDVYFHHPAGCNVLFARFSGIDEAEEARKTLQAGGKWDDVMKGYGEEGVLLEFTPSGEPAFVAEQEFAEGDLKEIGDTPLGKVSKALTLGEDNVVIVLREKKIEEKVIPFEEASRDAKEMVAYQKKRSGQSEYLQGLLAQAHIQVLAPEFFEAPAPEEAEGEEHPGGGASPAEEQGETARE